MRIDMSAGAVACAVAVCALGLAGPAVGQTHASARAAHVKPSLEGTWRVNFILSMEAPPGTPQLVVSEKDAVPVARAVAKAMSDQFAATLDPELPEMVLHSDGLPIVRGQRRTRAVVLPTDGKLPYTAAAQKELAATPPPEPTANPEERPNAERCLVGQGQPPLSSFALDSQIQIIATPDQVVIHAEYGDDVRIVPITREHAPRAMWTRMGDSIGRWEGATLVIETIGQPDADRDRIAPFLIVSGDSTVIERLTPISKRELLYQFTVVDPKVYAAPWLGEFSWFRTDKLMYESACHEGNYSLPNVLAGARHEEAVALAKATAGR